MTGEIHAAIGRNSKRQNLHLKKFGDLHFTVAM